MALLKLVWRQLWLRPGRTLLTLAGITIGVAAVVAMVVLEANARRQFEEVRETLSGVGGLEVVARTGGRFDAAIAESVMHAPGVADAAPILRQISTLYAGEGKTKALFIGVDPGRETEIRDMEVATGSLAKKNDEVVVDADLAKAMQIKVGDTVKLLTRRLLVGRTVAGIVRPRSVADGQLGATVFLPLGEMRDLFMLAGKADAIHVTIAPGANLKQVEEKVATLLPPALKVQSSGAYQTAGEQNYVLMDQALKATRTLLVVIAVFIALNTFLMNVGERQPTFAVLRAIGATARQVTTMLVIEAALLGVFGSLVGVWLGVVVSRPLIDEFEGTLGVAAQNVRFTPGLILGGLTLGTLVSLAAVAYPAFRAGQVSPLAGMRGHVSLGQGRLRPIFAYVGGASVILGVLGMYFAAIGSLPEFFFGASGGAVVLGGAAALNCLIGWISGVVSRVAGLFCGSEAELARRQVLRNPTRTWLTAATLFIALAATLAINNALFNVTDGVRAWRDRSLPVDFIVRTVAPRLEDAATTDLPASMGDDLAKIDGVAWIDPASFLRCTVGSTQGMLMVRDYGPYKQLPIDLKEGEEEDVRARLLAGEVVVNASLGQQLKLHVGDQVQITTEAGSRTARVAGVMMEFSFPGNVVCADRRSRPPLTALDSVDAFLITAVAGQAPELEKRLQAFCNEHGLLLQTQASIRDVIDRGMNSLTAGLWMLLVLAFVVASFGVFNSMAINVLEQTRELGLMRAIGMEPAQVRRMFVLQGAMIAAIGLLPGLIVGVGLGYAINRAFALMLGYAVTYELHPVLALSGVALGAAIVTATSYSLGARAARVSIRDALAEA